ncbi:MAG: nucleotidyl transferase AbiEii/AbiGii toxin family protein [Elusimicrobiota bacterium]|jgi:predicted nucleotidyltransferase component of viral defense system|nr:nucleotidyl transferase AbiEii/AbiGii toxin family protein [Elusimicrobiota bacterium]
MLNKNDKDNFIRRIKETSQLTGFNDIYIEKDYYATVFLSKISELSNNIIFKGGTALSKSDFFNYHRMSEDLDFQMRLPNTTITRKMRSDLMKEIKEKIKIYSEQFGMDFISIEAHNESRQYIIMFEYKSVIIPTKQTMEMDVNLQSNPLLLTEKKEIKHKFIDIFTKESLINTDKIEMLSLKELLSEKLRAAATREEIASRDFYDIDFAMRNNKIDFTNKEFISIFKEKLKQDNKDADILKYKKDCGRTKMEINQMREKLKDELLPVLNLSEQKTFSIDNALKNINVMMEKMIIAEKEQTKSSEIKSSGLGD